MHETAMQLTRTTANGRARAAALEAAARTEARATSLVAYASKGALVILGPGREALAAAERLAPALECTVVVTDDAQGNGPEGVTVVREKPLQVSGHLGQFNVIVAARPPLGGENLLRKLGGPRTHFDLVLDLCRPAHIGAPLPPFGYYAPSEPEALERALAELPEMVGEFEKAKFFQYDPSICAHGRSGLSGCTRCIDACPTWAIISMGDEIAVDPYLCQGAGACATACPTGAITYAYPRPGDSIDKLGALLKAYRAAGGEGAIVLFHDAEHGREALADLPAPLPERVIPIEIAEQGSYRLVPFPDEKKAYEGLHALQDLHAEASLTVWGTDVLRRDPDGRLSIVKRDDQGPLGTGLGALAGGLIGLFGGPIGAAVGVAVGATAGGVGDLVHFGVSEEFLTAIERDLAPGKFAVIAEIDEEWVVPLDSRMEQLGAKVVREDRLTFAEDTLEKRVNARKARLAQLKAEHAQRKAERAKERAGSKAETMLQKLLTEEIEDERRKLERIADKSEKRLDSAKEELAAKIQALRAQASGASPEVRNRIEARIVDVTNEFVEREQKLERAKELTRQALQA